MNHEFPESRFRSLTVLIAFLGLLATNAEAEILGVKIICNQKQVFVGQSFRFEVVVSTDGESPPKPTIPLISDLVVQPEGGRSEKLSIVNGRVTKSRIYAYRAQSQKVGPILLKGIRAGVLEASPVTISAVAKGEARSGREENRPIFVEATVDKNEVWQGEQIVFEYTIYWNFQIQGTLRPESVDLSPAFKGFVTWEKDFEISQKRTIVNGRQYMKALLRRVILFPLEPGEFEIPPINQPGSIEQRNPRDPFSGFFGGRRVTLEKVARAPVVTDPIKIKVNPIPVQGRPDSFSGNVGQYTFKAKLNKNEAAVGESLTLTLSISGDGHVDSLAPPKLKLPDWVEAYDPERTSDPVFREDIGRLQGTARWDIILIPRLEGTMILEPIEFSFFDPQNGRFLTLKQGPFRIEVTPDKGQAITYMQGKRKRLRVTGTDFRHIHPAQTKIADEAAPLVASAVFWSLMAGPWGLFIGLFAYRRRTDYLERNPDVAGKIRVRGETKQRLANAANLVEEGGDRFYGELENALHDHLSACLGTSTRGLTRDQLLEALSLLDPGLLEYILNLLSQLENLRYASVDAGVWERRSLLEETRALLGKVKM